MRAAITIIYNGFEDLNYKGFATFMAGHFDMWILVEGSSKNTGSTSWCKSLITKPHSKDGTVEMIKSLAENYPNVYPYFHSRHYRSKDEQFNKGIDVLKSLTDSCTLWQVDCDEHWMMKDIVEAEKMLYESDKNVASFQFNHYVKEDVIAKGDWGSGRVNRLWKWSGESFVSHEPSVMEGQSTPVELPQKFNHYSMVHEKSVKFKSRLYRGHEQVYMNWKKLETEKFPCHISKLFGTNNPIGRSNSTLHKINLPCVNVTNHAPKEANNIQC